MNQEKAKRAARFGFERVMENPYVSEQSVLADAIIDIAEVGDDTDVFSYHVFVGMIRGLREGLRAHGVHASKKS